MTTFFFTINDADCISDCRWQICPQRYLSELRKRDGLRNILTLFGERSCLSPAQGRVPRTGDLIILYAKDLQDLEAMIEAGDLFDGLKKILVVADPSGVDGRKYHLLAPRFITHAGRNMAELEAVIRKMKQFVH